MTTIDLICLDGAKITIPRSAERLSGTIKLIFDGDEEAKEIFCPCANEPILHRLEEYLEYHLSCGKKPKFTNTPILNFSNLNEVLADPWDARFCQSLSVTEVLKLVEVADFLAIEHLLDILRSLFAFHMRPCTREEIQTIIQTHKWVKNPKNKTIDAQDDLLRLQNSKELFFLIPGDIKPIPTNGLDHLIALLNQSEIETEFDNIPNYFYQSAMRYSFETGHVIDTDLVCSRKDLSLCGCAGEFSPGVNRVQKVDSKSLKSAIKWLKHHQGVAPQLPQQPVRSIYIEKTTDAWQANFIKSLSKRELFSLILASRDGVLDIFPLHRLACAQVACWLKGKSPEEMKRILSIQ